MQRNCKKALKIRKMSFIAAVFKNGSVKAREKKIQRLTPWLRIQSNFHSVYGNATLQKMLRRKTNKVLSIS